MRLFFLSSLTMTAFAANSILNRLAVDSGASDPASFALIRVLSGAIMLVCLAKIKRRHLTFLGTGRFIGAGALVLYMVGFSSAYLTLDAGLGALILFGVVQISMFFWTSVRGAPPLPGQIVGALIAFSGLIWVLWPTGATVIDPVGIFFMCLAGVGWAAYTLVGRSEPDALAGTAANFCLALPLVFVAFFLQAGQADITFAGLVLAVLSGAVTSGLGYALWYSIVPQFSASVAAILQLAVPVIALVAGVALLGEQATVRLVFGAVLVLGGIAFAVWAGHAGKRAK